MERWEMEGHLSPLVDGSQECIVCTEYWWASAHEMYKHELVLFSWRGYPCWPSMVVGNAEKDLTYTTSHFLDRRLWYTRRRQATSSPIPGCYSLAVSAISTCPLVDGSRVHRLYRILVDACPGEVHTRTRPLLLERISPLSEHGGRAPDPLVLFSWPRTGFV